MALLLIGTGISFDLTLNAINELKNCNEIYIERYTNLIEDEKIKALEREIGKQIKIIGRTDVESDFLIKRAKEANVALLVSGDPLTATTHVTLLLDAKNKKVETKVIHNSSIYTVAAGKSGLQIYRFGKTASLVNPRDNYKPTSSLDIIRENLSRNLHTLVLLDTEPKFMDAKDALEMLSEFEHAVVLSRLGEPDEKITYGKIAELKKKSESLGKPPFSIIIPAKLHMMEEEYLETLK
ncbi:MAG: diphthine synthase [Candidatus Micrarchaeia archaeon]|jgi:diphthine synthase